MALTAAQRDARRRNCALAHAAKEESSRYEKAAAIFAEELSKGNATAAALRIKLRNEQRKNKWNLDAKVTLTTRLKQAQAEGRRHLAAIKVQESRILVLASREQELLVELKGASDSHQSLAEKIFSVNSELRDCQQRGEQQRIHAISLERQLLTATKSRESGQQSITQLQIKITALMRDRRILRVQLSRSRSETHQAITAASTITHWQRLKNKGIITEAGRLLVHELTRLGLPSANISEALRITAEAWGISITGSISRRSVSCIILEGLTAAKLQIVDAVHAAEGVSLSADGRYAASRLAEFNIRRSLCCLEQ
ncbi:hypothetical protein PUNSTDRAFT_42633 [Punctularia strigosozonata HHB-11173 SS5]|uniref:uncharacterized protein n=1 Tax=Punctularia strigosozonata (strain HHB-11173) TaxID=741275 RepID=UPI0004417C86|nr:uncharacterized protein PUNSTDRAFT_42633 [Punctularia strigosozonata HHB-11173 SS5]EIN11340.1 hypothetical protein PUNSTDRAFT_42633 [Punctularia strigosozonata HHB-11173 SS5]